MQRDKQAGRQTDILAGRLTNRQADGQTGSDRPIQTDRRTENKHTGGLTDRQIVDIKVSRTGHIAACRTSGSAWFRRRVVSLSLYGGSSSLWCRCVYLSIYAKLGLVIGMTKQMSNGKEADIVNC